MFYLIDFDSRTPLMKAGTADELEDHVFDSELELATCIVGSADDLERQLNLDELQALYYHFDLATKHTFTDANVAAKACWELLNADEPAKEPERKTNTRLKLDPDEVVIVVIRKCRRGSPLSAVIDAVDNEMLDTVSEVLEHVKSCYVDPRTDELCDTKCAESHLKKLVRQGKVRVC